MSRQGYVSFTGARVFLSLRPRYANSEGVSKRDTLVSISDELHDFISREALTPKGETIRSSYPYRAIRFDRSIGIQGAFIPKLPNKFRKEFRELIRKFAPKAFEPNRRLANERSEPTPWFPGRGTGPQADLEM